MASWSGMPLFQALRLVSGGDGSYLAIRQWEIELMIELRMRPEQYSELVVEERSYMICARHLPKWMEVLETNKAIQEMESRGAGNV